MTDRKRMEAIERRLAEKHEAVRQEVADAPSAPMTLQSVLETTGEVISVSVGPQGQLLAASTSEATTTDVVQGGPTPLRFPSRHSGPPFPVVLDVLTPSWHTVLEIPDLPLTMASFQPMPGGEWLAVSPFARFNDGQPDHNALVLDRAGSPVHSFCIGDGISHVQVSPKGVIWVAYLDEGVFRTWGGREGPPNPGSAGLTCWSRLGTMEWDY